MRPIMPLLAAALLFTACTRKLSPLSSVPVEHLQKVALKNALEKCKSDDDECAPPYDIAVALAEQSVSKATAGKEYDCDDPPCEWPDTIPMAFLVLAKKTDYTAVKLFPCDDPPCEWPDTIPSLSKSDFGITFTHLAGQSYEFELLDEDNEVIAFSKPMARKGGKPFVEGKRVQAFFTVTNPNYAGAAKLLIRRTELGKKEPLAFTVNATVANPLKK